MSGSFLPRLFFKWLHEQFFFFVTLTLNVTGTMKSIEQKLLNAHDIKEDGPDSFGYSQ